MANARKFSKLLKIGEAAELLGVSIDTLRRWDASGKLISIKTPGGTRYYSLTDLGKINPHAAEAVKEASQGREVNLLDLEQIEDLNNQPIVARAQPAKSKINIGLPQTNEYESRTNNYESWGENQIKRGKVGKLLRRPAGWAASLILILSLTGIISGLIFREQLSSSYFGKKTVVNNAFAGQVLAENTAKEFLQINADTRFERTINDLILKASTGSALTVNGQVSLDQDLTQASSPTFAAINLSNQNNQLGVLGGNKITFPQATGTVLLDTATQTVTNKSLSGSSNTFSNIPNSALSNPTINITTGGIITGGGTVSLGGTINLTATATDSGVQATTSAGYIPRMEASGVLGNSGFYDLSGNIGLGTTAPTNKLDISGTINATAFKVGGTAGVTVGTAACVTTVNGIVTGSGACAGLGLSGGNTNYIAKWSSPNDITYGLLYDSGTAVSLGTSSPLATLDIRSQSGINSIASFSGSTANAALLINQSGSGAILAASSGGITKFIIGNDGNVGIGTAAPPGYNLYVGGTTNITGATTIGSGLTVSSGGINLTGSQTFDATGILNIGTGSQTALNLGQVNAPTTIRGSTVTVNVSQFSTSGNATISGTLGVGGEASVSGKLILDSQTAQINATNNRYLDLGFQNTGGVRFLNSSNYVDSNGNLFLQGSLYTSGNQAGFWQRTLGSIAPVNITDSVNIGATATTSALVHLAGTNGENSFINTGNVGIGTTNPNNFKLQVAGNVGPQTTDTYDLGSSSVEWNNIYGRNFYVSGNIIGPSSGTSGFFQRAFGALAPTNVTDSLIIGGTATGSGQIQFYGLNALNPVASISALSSQAALVIDNRIGDLFTASSSGLTRFVITQNGNVGVGSSNPGATVDVTGTGRFSSTLTASNGLTVSAGSVTFPNTSIANAALQGSGALTVSAGTGLSGGGSVALGASTTLNLANTTVTTGSYGDSTHVASFTVDQQGRLTAAGNVAINTSPTGAAGGDLSGTYPNPQVAQITGNSFFQVDSAGRVTNPGANGLLNIPGALQFNDLVAIAGTSSAYPALAVGGNTGQALVELNQAGTGDIFAASASGVNRLVITNSGNVGVGTYAPTALTDLLYTGNGNALQVKSTDIAFQSGKLLNIDFSPLGATTYTGNLVNINVGAMATVSGQIFAIQDNGSDLFTVNQSQAVFNNPVSFNAPGDVSIAYDVNFTNTTASFIKSAASLYLQAGLNYNSDNLSLGTYNKGNVIADTEAFLTTGAATVSGQLLVGTSSATPNIGNFYLTNSGTFGQALAILNQTESADILAASVSGTTKFVINSAGNVGIGSAAPATALDVYGKFNVDSTGNITKINNVAYSFPGSQGAAGSVLTNNGSGTLTWQGVSGNGSIGYWQQNSGVLAPTNVTDDLLIGGQTGTASAATTKYFQVFGTGTNAGAASTSAFLTLNNSSTNYINALNNQAISFRTSPGGDAGLTDRLTILGNGNVGIGTTSPVDNLVVNTSGSPGGIGLRVIGTAYPTLAAYNSTNGNGGQLCLSSSTSGAWCEYVQGNDLRVNNGSDIFTFQKGGNVGIGTTGPVGLLNVYGAVTGKALTELNQNGGDQAVFTASVSGTSKFTINNSGQIGLGTGANNNTFLADLDVRQLTSNSFVASISGSTGKAALTVDNTIGDLFTASSSGLSRFVIKQGGNVGIGTTNPTNAALTAVSGNAYYPLSIGRGAETFAFSQDNINTGDTYDLQLLPLLNNSGFSAYYKTSGGTLTAGLNMNASGNVGIGTTNPANFKLQVAGGIGPNANNSTDLGSSSFKFANMWTVLSHVGDLVFEANNNHTTFTEIGTTGLAINDANANHILQLQSPNSNNFTASVSAQTGLAALLVDNTVGDIFAASSSGMPRFVINQNGNVGIGTTNPQYPLSVAGNANVTGTLTVGGTVISATGDTLWQRNSGVLAARNITDSLIVGGSATGSGQIQFYGVNNLGPVASVSGKSATSAFIVDNQAGSDIFTASSSGLTRFRLDTNGNMTVSGTVNGATITGGSLSSTAVNGVTTANILTTATSFAGGDIASGTYNSLTLANTSVSSGSYGDGTHVATFTVDSKGRLTAAGNVAISAGVTSFNSATGAVTLEGTAGQVNVDTTGGTNTVSLSPNSYVWGNFAAATFNGVTIATGTGTLSLGSNTLTVSGASNINQDVRTSASPTFAGLTVSGNATVSGTLGVGGEASLSAKLTIDSLTAQINATNNRNLELGFMNTGRIEFLNANNYVTPTTAYINNYQVCTASGNCIGGGGGSIGGSGNLNYIAKFSPDGVHIANSQLYDSGSAVALGTTSPLATLDVRALSGLTPTASISGATGLAGLIVDNSGTGDLFTASSSGLNRFVITQNGNVGIGTSVPANKLSVAGGIQLGASLGSNDVLNTVAAGGVPSGALYWGSRAVCDASGNCAGLGGVVSGTGTTNYLAKWTSSTGIGTGLIYDNGNGIGINTTVPLAFFDIESSGTSSAIASISGKAARAALIVDNSGTGDLFAASSSGLNRFVITQNGNVGIGTTNPGNPLSVTGNANFTGSVGIGSSSPSVKLDIVQNGADGIRLSSATSNGVRLAVGTWASNYNYIQSTKDGSGTTVPLRLQIDSINAMTIDTTGNVGIGTTAPTGLLHVQGAPAGKALTVLNYQGTDQNILVASQGGVLKFALSGLNGSPVASISATSGVAGLMVDNTVGDLFTASSSGLSRFVITQNGNVGIGTTNPAVRLSIVGRANLNDGITLQKGTDSYLATIRFNDASGNEKWSMGYTGNVGTTLPNNNDYAIWQNGDTTQTRLYFQSGGNIGIGTTSPLGLLDVEGKATGKALTILNQTGDQAIFAASVSGANKFIIANSGNVGIGSSAPTALTDILNLGNANALQVMSTDIALTSGKLVNIDFSPLGATTYTGNLVNINVGAMATISGQIFNIQDNGSDIFSVNQSQLVSNVPVSFNAPGDVSIAYDVNFTNTTASYLKSAASLYLTAGLNYNSDNLQLGTYNKGNVIADTEAFLTTGAATVSGQLSVGTSSATPNIGNFYLTNSSVFGQALAILNQTESADLFTASASGVTKIRIDNTGNILPGATDAQNLGSAALEWNNIYVKNLIATGGTSGFLQRASGVLAPTNITDSLIIGNVATPSGAITTGSMQIYGVNNLNPVASISAVSATAALVVDNRVGDLFTASSSGLNRFVITQNGNVGIGTTNPSQQLDITGNLNVGKSNGSLTTVFDIGTGNLNLTRAGTSYANAFNFYTSTNQYGQIGFSASSSDLQVNAVRTDGALRLMTNGTDRIYIQSGANGGNVGIGTTSPVGLLNVNGAVTGKALVELNQNGGDQAVFTASVSGVTKFLIDNSGNASISGALNANNTNIYGDLAIKGNTTITNPLAGAGSETTGLLLNGSNQIVTRTLGSNAFTSTAYVPTTRTVNGRALSSDITLNLASSDFANQGTTTTVLHGNASGNPSWGAVVLGTDTSGNYVVTAQGTANQVLVNTDTAAHAGAITLSLPQNIDTASNVQFGKLGLGASPTLATLDVRSASGLLPTASISGATGMAGLIVDNSGTGDLFTASSSGLNRFVITQNGSVGIGTTVPAASAIMDLSSTTQGLLTPRLNTTQRNAISSPATGLLIYNTSDNQFNVYTGSIWTSVGAGGANATQWQMNSGVIAPYEISQSVAIGNTATTSAFLILDGVTGFISNQSTKGGLNNIPGSVAINDNLTLAATSAAYPAFSLNATTGQAAFILNQADSGGDLLAASAAGVNKFVIDKAGNVGIGSSNPQQKLDVNGIINTATGFKIGNAAATAGHFLRGDGTNYTDNTIQTSDLPGNFSGFANPTASIGLTVVNGTATTAMRSDAAPALSQAIAPTWTGIHTFSNLILANANSLFSAGASVASNSGSAAALTVNQSGAADIFTASQAGVTKFVILNNGNVGIGSSVPGANLDVIGTGRFSSTLTASNGLTLSAGGMSIAGSQSITGSTLTVDATGSLTLGRSGVTTTINGTTVTANSAVFNSNGKSYFSGNVGIGTTDPATFQLQVAGHVGPQTDNTYDLGSSTAAWRNLYAYNIITPLNQTGSNGYWQRASGVVAPNSLSDSLIIGKTATASGAITSGSIQLFGVNNLNPVASISAVSATAAFVVDNRVGDLFTASSSGLNRFVITQNGNVGIGTTVPANQLDVTGTGSFSTSVVTPLLTNTNDLTISTTANNGSVKISPNGSGVVRLGVNTSSLITGNELLQLDDSAGSRSDLSINVAGGATPNFNLVGHNGTLTAPTAATTNEIFGAIKFMGYTGASYQSGAAIMGIAKADAGATSIPGVLAFQTTPNGTYIPLERVRIDDQGNVGIGSTSPIGLLNVKGAVTGKALVELNQNGGDQNIFVASMSGVNKFRLNGIGTDFTASVSGLTTNAALSVQNEGLGDLFTASGSAGTTRFVITNAGNVGIGSSNPSQAALTVTGGGYFTTGLGINDTNITTGVVNVATGFRIANAASAGKILRANGTNFITSTATFPDTVTAGDLLYASGSNVVGSLPDVAVNQVLVSGGVGALPSYSAAITVGTSVTSPTINATTALQINGASINTGGATPTLSNVDYLDAIQTISAQKNFSANLWANSGLSVASSSGSTAALTVNQSGTGPIFTASVSGVSKFVINNLGQVGINIGANNSTTLGDFSVRSISGLMPVATFSGQTGTAALTVDNSGTGDLFTASSSGLSRFVINQNGNVGIGTTAPVYLNHTYTSLDDTSGANGTVAFPMAIERNDPNSPKPGAGVGLKFVFSRGDLGVATASAAILSNFPAWTGGSGTNGVLDFQTANNSTLGTRMRIDQNGNVGIGTTTINNRVTILGSADISGNLGVGTTAPVGALEINKAQTGKALAIFNQQGTDQAVMVASVSGTAVFMIDNVGLLSNPGSTYGLNSIPGSFGINDNLSVAATSAAYPAVRIDATTGQAAMILNQADTGGDLFAASAAGSLKFVINKSGNVGIGSSAPAALADLLYLGNGNALQVKSTDIALTSGKLFNLDFSPLGATTYTGNLVNINVGAMATVSGQIFDIQNAGSDLFSVNQSQIVNSLPTSFNAAGDVAVAYDINFTNPTSSFIKSAAPLTIQSGEIFNSSDLNLKTFYKGNVNITSEATTFSGAATVSGTLNVGTQSAGLATWKLYVSDYQLATASALIENTTPNGANQGCSIAGKDLCHTGLIIKLGQPGSTTVPTTNDAFIQFLDGVGVTKGKIVGTASTGVAQYLGGGDFGEYYTLDSKILSQYGVGANWLNVLPEGTVMCQGADGVHPCEASESAKILGVRSDRSGFVGGDNNGSNVLVGLIGEVPIKIATNSGAIMAGDMLTIADNGLAQKATGRGYIVGVARENWTPNSGKDSVMSLVRPGYDEGDDLNLASKSSVDELQQQVASLSAQFGGGWTVGNNNNVDIASFSAELATISGQLTVLGQTNLANTTIGGTLDVGLLHFDDLNGDISSLNGLLSFQNGNVTIDSLGNVKATGTVTAKKINIDNSNVAGASAGKIVIPAGQTSITVSTTALTNNSMIFVTPVESPVAVSAKNLGNGSLQINLAGPQTGALTVNWWIVN